MSSEDKQEQSTFLLYNMSITELNLANNQYSEATKEMCEVAVLGTLVKAYMCQDVYLRVLQYMRDNGLYERYIKSILELQFYPPKIEESKQSEVENSSSPEKKQDKGEKGSSSGGVATKVDKYDKISKKFMHDLFNDDDNFM